MISIGKNNLLIKGLFALAVITYLIVWIFEFIFEYNTFGGGAAITSSVALVIPFVISLKMFIRWHSLRGREFIYLLILVILAFGTDGYLNWNGYDKGLDITHALDMEFIEFGQLLHKDPAFQNVILMQTSKEKWLEGTVKSNEDLFRLRKLAEEGEWDTEYVKVRR
jgi:hypothetical protein